MLLMEIIYFSFGFITYFELLHLYVRLVCFRQTVRYYILFVKIYRKARTNLFIM